MLSRSQNMSKIVSSYTLRKDINYLQMHSIALILPMCIRSKDKLQKSADHEEEWYHQNDDIVCSWLQSLSQEDQRTTS